MDNVSLALSIAIAVVVVLLITCWDWKPKKKPRKVSTRVSRQAVDDSDSCGNGVGVSESDYGRGVTNMRAAERYQDLSQNLAGYGDYAQVAQYMALEPEVYESHQRFAEEANLLNLGPSNMSERSDPNDVVPWVGLRRPDYQSVYANCTARVEHSEIPDQMNAQRAYTIGI
jgi:hypothetical protein